MNWRCALARAFAMAALFALPLTAANAQEVYGPKDETAKAGWDGEVTVIGGYAKRSRELVDDYDRSGVGLRAVAGYSLPAGKTTTVHVEARTRIDEYNTSVGSEVELVQGITKDVDVAVSAAATSDIPVLESLKADQASVQAALTIRSGEERIEAYGRHRWRRYNDFTAGTGQGWQLGTRWRHRFGAYHWFNAHAAWDRIDDNGGRHGYKRTSVSLDYSHPVAMQKRLRLLAGADYRVWTYDGRTVGDVVGAARRHDYLIRPEAGLSWGKTKGLYLRATAGYDIYRSNDPRYDGDGPRARLEVGFRF